MCDEDKKKFKPLMNFKSTRKKHHNSCEGVMYDMLSLNSDSSVLGGRCGVLTGRKSADLTFSK